MGAPLRSEAGPEKVEQSLSMEDGKGKTVERVAMEDRFRIRRASVADSWTVGIWELGEKDEGLENTCRGGGTEAETRGKRGRRERRRPEG